MKIPRRGLRAVAAVIGGVLFFVFAIQYAQATPSTSNVAGINSSAQTVAVNASTVGNAQTATTTSQAVSPSGPRLTPSQLKIVNYYPARAPWNQMWTSYDHSTIASDMAAVASLGANTVRVIVQPYAVGWPTLTASGSAELNDVISTAAANGLHVMLTLFDGWGTYNQISDSQTWAASVLRPYVTDSRVALIEVQNELPISRSGAEPWAQTMLAFIRKFAPAIPTTVSLAGTATSAQITQMVKDFYPQFISVVDLHLYGSIAQMTAMLQSAKTAAPSAPIMVGEAGVSTGVSNTSGAQQNQVYAYRQVWRICASFNIKYFAPWILNDIDSPGQSQQFGLRTVAGVWKPAAAVIKQMFSTTTAALATSSDNLLTDGNFGSENVTPDASRSLGAWTLTPAQIGAGGTMPTNDSYGMAGYLTRAYANQTGWPALIQTSYIAGIQRLKLTAQVRLVNATGSTTIGLGFYNGSQLITVIDGPLAKNAISGWQTISLTAIVPNGASTVVVGLKTAGNSGTSQFSAVSLTQT